MRCVVGPLAEEGWLLYAMLEHKHKWENTKENLVKNNSYCTRKQAPNLKKALISISFQYPLSSLTKGKGKQTKNEHYSLCTAVAQQ